MSENTSRLVVQNLQKSFKKRQVVKSFSLEIESGEVIGLLGPNGAGKTTSFYSSPPTQAALPSTDKNCATCPYTSAPA